MGPYVKPTVSLTKTLVGLTVGLIRLVLALVAFFLMAPLVLLSWIKPVRKFQLLIARRVLVLLISDRA